MVNENRPEPSESNVQQRTPSFGEALVGIGFNPSNDSDVNKAKRLCAELADLIHRDWVDRETDERSMLRNQLYNHTVGEILNAQMNVVKLLTLKY